MDLHGSMHADSLTFSGSEFLNQVVFKVVYLQKRNLAHQPLTHKGEPSKPTLTPKYEPSKPTFTPKYEPSRPTFNVNYAPSRPTFNV